MKIITNTACKSKHRNSGPWRSWDDYSEKCIERDSADYASLLTDEMFCAEEKGTSRATCTGDSGGPITVQDKKTKQHYLAGVISWSFDCYKTVSLISSFQFNNNAILGPTWEFQLCLKSCKLASWTTTWL